MLYAEDSNATTATGAGMESDEDEAASHLEQQAFDHEVSTDLELQYLQVGALNVIGLFTFTVYACHVLGFNYS
jgi:hypothetical protein